MRPIADLRHPSQFLMNNRNISALINALLSSVGDEMALANELEVAIDEAYPNDDHMQQVVEVLACFRPGGGQFLFDREQLRPHLLMAKEYLSGSKSSMH